MTPQVRYDSWLIVSSELGDEVVPCSLVGCGAHSCVVTEDDDTFDELFSLANSFVQGCHITQFEIRDGWGARLTMPGYLDCTEWTIFRTKEEAEEYLKDLQEGD
jgi:hypothetical protein